MTKDVLTMPNPTTPALLTSIRRTVVPAVMGWVASLPIAPLIDQAELERALVVVLGAAYYAGLRWLEQQGVQAAGWWIAFGRTPQPHYFKEA
jgi:hypothetical protein